MSTQPFPFWSLQDSSGVPLVGAKIQFFVGGTDTPQNVYSDRARTASLGSEVTVNAAGLASSGGNAVPIYLEEGVTYKAVLLDADDVVLNTVDDIIASGSSTGGGGGSRATCPLDYGAIGDGVADERVYIQAAIDDATGEVDLAGMTYRVDNTVNLKSGIKFRNGNIQTSVGFGAAIVNGTGTMLNTAHALTAGVQKGETSLTISDASSFLAGDMIYLYSTSRWNVANTVYRGEMCTIKSIAGNTITLDSSINDEYLVADSASIKLVQAIENVVVEDIRITAPKYGSQSGIYIAYARNCKISRCTVDGAGNQSTGFLRSIDCHISNIYATGTTNNIAAVLFSCQRSSITDSTGVHCTSAGFSITAATNDYPSRYCSISNCSSYGTGNGHHMSDSTQYCSIVNCRSDGCTNGILDEGSQNTVSGNIIRHCTGYGIKSQTKRRAQAAMSSLADPASLTDLSGGSYTNNVIEACGDYGITLAPAHVTGLLVGAYDISGNIIRGCLLTGIYVSIQDSEIVGLTIDNNKLYDAQGGGISAILAANCTLTRLSVSGNIISYSGDGGSGIELDGLDGASVSLARVSNNTVEGYEYSVKLDNATSISVLGNILSPYATTGKGVYVEYSDSAVSTVKNLDISSNQILNAGSFGVKILQTAPTTLQSVSVRSNKITGTCAYGIHVPAVNTKGVYDISIQSNDIKLTGIGVYLSGDDSPTGVIAKLASNLIDCTGQGVFIELFTDVDITGNTIISIDSDCVRIDGATFVNVSGNTLNTSGGPSYDAVEFNSPSSNVVQCNISGNNCFGPIHYHNTATASKSVSISSNNVRSGSYAYGIMIENDGILSGVSIVGNHVLGNNSVGMIVLDTAGLTTGVTDFIVSGNSLVASDDDTPGILLQSEANGTIGSGLISGNFVANGSYGVSETVATITKVAVMGNYFVGCAAQINGSFDYAPSIATGASASTDAPNMYTA